MSKYLGNLKVGSFSFKFNAVILYTMSLGQHGSYCRENNLETIAKCHRNGGSLNLKAMFVDFRNEAYEA